MKSDTVLVIAQQSWTAFDGHSIVVMSEFDEQQLVEDLQQSEGIELGPSCSPFDLVGVSRQSSVDCRIPISVFHC